MTAQTLYDKIWNSHVIKTLGSDTDLIYIDRHLVHEVTSPQAFEGLRVAGRPVHASSATLAVADHNVPTSGRTQGIADPESRQQIDTLSRNTKDFGITLFDMNDQRQGIVHIIGPEQGFTLPGTTIVCGDSHTSTHGAFGALAFGIGTSEVEHVLATQTLQLKRAKNMRITVNGTAGKGFYAKDIILAIIGKIGTAGGTGHVLEYAGPAIRALSMEGRMTICNMSIEAGARAGLIAPDETTIAYLHGRPLAPTGDAWDQAVASWRSLHSDDDAHFDREVELDITHLPPQVTWGTTPEAVLDITASVPSPRQGGHFEADQRALDYMGLTAGTKLQDIKIDKVFIGSCTNARIEDLRIAAQIAKGRQKASHVEVLVVPGSGLVKKQAEDEGLDRIFKEAGFQWREPGCSMCLAMNADKLQPGERCASTSNRNFEGRQGRGGRTHLMSPASASASAIAGRLADVRDFL